MTDDKRAERGAGGVVRIDLSESARCTTCGWHHGSCPCPNLDDRARRNEGRWVEPPDAELGAQWSDDEMGPGWRNRQRRRLVDSYADLRGQPPKGAALLGGLFSAWLIMLVVGLIATAVAVAA